MNGQEAQNIINMLNGYWRHSPLDDAGAKLWAIELLELDFAKTAAAVRRMAKTPGSFPPSLGDLLAAVNPPPSAREAFQKVLSIMLLYPADQRGPHTPDTIAATVRRLGGWSVVGQMDRDKREWNDKRWDSAWEEVHAEIAAGRPMAELLPQPRLGLVQGAVAGALGKGAE